MSSRTLRLALSVFVFSALCASLPRAAAAMNCNNSSVAFASVPKAISDFALAEKKHLVGAFGIDADIIYFQENPKERNCVTTFDSVFQSNLKPTVFIGLTMFGQVQKVGGHDTVLQVIMAHEWGHVVQAHIMHGGGSNADHLKKLTQAQIERQADYLAGWFLAVRAQGANANQQTVNAEMDKVMGYYDTWSDSSTHGAIADRKAGVVAAFNAQYKSAMKAEAATVAAYDYALKNK